MTSNRTYSDACGVACSLNVVGERWALLIVRELMLGPKRFNDLLAGLQGASPNVITQRLRELAASGVVARRDLGPPARVHVYELTDRGREVEPILLELGRWGAGLPAPPGGQIGVDSLLLSMKVMFDPKRAANLAGSYELRVGADAFDIEIRDGTLGIRRGRPADPDATMSTDLATLHAICRSRRPLKDAVRSGNVRIDGDPQDRKRLTSLIDSIRWRDPSAAVAKSAGPGLSKT
ncbi:MAG: transcriptional regulator [Mycobacterium sp.]|nr:transcriptional regulator [Mycobacterium sp.]